jgi:CheY-like chemotaxis protein
LIAALRSALHYLYDPVHLRNSPLVALLGLADQFDSATALQTQLTAAIRNLKPTAEEPPQSRTWRVYDVLHFQYIRQLDRAAVATQLGISERQLRREQRVALEVLAQQLLPQLDQTQAAASDTTLFPPPGNAEQALSEELLWLKKSTAEAPISLHAALSTVQQLVRPLADQWQTPLRVDVAPNLADHPTPPLLLRSILPTILSVAIPRAGQQPITIAATQSDRRLTISVLGHAHQPQAPLREQELTSLQTAEALAHFHGATLIFPRAATDRFVATLSLPLPTQVPILVIDDNADWLALQQRYLDSSRYQLTGVTDSTRATALAAQLQPAVILLDVMMQTVDGWQILSELRHEPTTTTIPVVICTILPVADLALALGANAFLQKPVTQTQLLQVLDRWAGVGKVNR